MKERKCPKCKTWNTDQVFCLQCDEPLTADERNKKFKRRLNKEAENRPISSLERFALKMKISKYFPVRWAYYFFYSIWWVYMLILSVFVFLIATTPG